MPAPAVPDPSAQPAPEARAHAVPDQMRAATHVAYGTAADVSVSTIARPDPGPDQVLLEVGAAGLDRATLHLLEGKPYVARLALGLRRPRRCVLGQQVAGRVLAVGADVTGVQPGERVFGTASSGAFAPYAVARTATLAPTPDDLTDDVAATLGVSGITAYGALDRTRVVAGDEVLILGASGAVGTYAVQLAAARGAQVTGLSSAAKTDLVRSLGAVAAHDYRSTTLADLGRRFDVIIDIAGNRPLRELRAALAPQGRLVIVGGEGGGPLLGGIERNFLASAAGLLTQQKLGWFYSSPTTTLCAELAAVLTAQGLRPPIDRVVGLDGVPDAIAAMAAGQLRGHVVVRP